MSNVFSTLGINHTHADTNEMVLTYSEVQTVVDHLKKTMQALILGGDVLTALGHYTYCNWYYEPDDTSPWEHQVTQSCNQTEQYIMRLKDPDTNKYILVLKEKG